MDTTYHAPRVYRAQTTGSLGEGIVMAHMPPPMTDVRRREEGGWAWSVLLDDGGDQVHYRTDANGEGLWLNEGRGNLDRQLLGHAQWGLAGMTAQARRRRVAIEMAKRHGIVDRD